MADKRNNTVILDKKDYIDKMKIILGENTKFQSVQFKRKNDNELRHILDMEDHIKNSLKDHLKNNSISKIEYDKLVPIVCQPRILYECAKIHKKKLKKINSGCQCN